MALIDVKLDTTELKRKLRRLQTSAVNFTPIMQVVAEMLVTAVSDRYQSEGDGQWPPHAAATIQLTGPHKLMQLTGVLSGSTTAASGEDYAEAYTSVDYIKYHLEGGPKIPKRNPFEIGDEPMAEATDYILAEVIALVNAA
jgi:phage gpG-like protein